MEINISFESMHLWPLNFYNHACSSSNQLIEFHLAWSLQNNHRFDMSVHAYYTIHS